MVLCDRELLRTSLVPSPERGSVSVSDRCGYVTAAGIRCRRDDGHSGTHDTLYIFDALPERPEPIADPLPEDLERLLRDPRIVLDRDADVAALIVADLLRRPHVETVPRAAYLALWYMYEKAAGGQSQ